MKLLKAPYVVQLLCNRKGGQWWIYMFVVPVHALGLFCNIAIFLCLSIWSQSRRVVSWPRTALPADNFILKTYHRQMAAMFLTEVQRFVFFKKYDRISESPSFSTLWISLSTPGPRHFGHYSPRSKFLFDRPSSPLSAFFVRSLRFFCASNDLSTGADMMAGNLCTSLKCVASPEIGR